MPFVRQRVRCIELVTYFFYQILALEILHEGVRRFAWCSHNIRHIPDPQRTRVQNSRKYIANSVRFDRQTWRSVGGSGSPAKASAAEQLMRAKKLYAQRGASPWPVCGKYLR